jgi:Spy/CpxP family protein refolding chaperone
MKRSNLLIALYMSLVFASGILVGAYGFRVYANSATGAPIKPKPSPAEYRKQYVSDMQTLLSLTPGQVARVNQIMDETDALFHEQHEKRNAAIKQIREGHLEKIRAALTPEQLPRFEKWRLEREQRDRAERERREKAAQAAAPGSR